MRKSELRQLIVESIQEYMRSIDEAGNIAALEAKMNKIDEEIRLREEKIGRVNELAELQEFVDPAKINEIKKEINALKKGKEKYKKQHGKMKGKKGEEQKPIEAGKKKEELDERKSPLSKKEEETAKKMKPALKSMEKQYGKEKGKQVFYGKVRKQAAK